MLGAYMEVFKSRFGRPQGKGTFGTDHPHSLEQIFKSSFTV